jgi:hypothetical protein
MLGKQLVLIVVLTISVFSKTKLEIISVSQDPVAIQNPVASSLMGNRRVYIDVVGHSTDPRDLTIMAGSCPCLIEDGGVDDTSITCRTTIPPESEANRYLYISLTSKGKTVTTSYPNAVVYASYYTPTLEECSSGSSTARKIIAC